MNAEHKPTDTDLTSIETSSSRQDRLWGALLVLLGIAAMLMPLASGLAVAVTLGVILIIAGSAQLAFALQARRFRKSLTRILFGGITLAAGVFCVTQSGAAAAALGLLVAAYFVADGIFLLASAWRSEAHTGWLATYGVLSIVLGLLLWLGWPLTGILAIGVLLGIRLIFAGVMLVMIGASPARVHSLA
ncbi:MAG: DUF308 domain-containing protein [Halieaceae bacterium]|jgi:uncharacterized membrane protein HdeD (DUF308 family)|nr:DUF308 domain-containing protein [Halieaceae bacterium]